MRAPLARRPPPNGENPRSALGIDADEMHEEFRLELAKLIAAQEVLL